MAQRSVWLCVLALSSTLAAQSALTPGEVAVITTDGLWLVRPTTGEVFVAPATSFGGLTFPAIEWRPGTDELLVCNADHLFRVTVNLGSTVSIADITPAGVSGADLRDLEIHPVDGRLVLLDAAQSQLLRYAPPFAAGMAPDLVVPIAAGAEALAIDSRSWPPEVNVAYATEVQAQGLQGGATTYAPVAFDGMDRDRQSSNVLVGVRTGINSVLAIATDHLAIEVNLLSSLCTPVALRPVDVEYDTTTDCAVVLAQKGLSACMPGYTGKNVVIALPMGQQVGPQVPTVLTGTNSSITGVAGDLTLVWGADQAFAGSYGSQSGVTPLQLLAPLADPVPGPSNFALSVKSAPPMAPVLLLVGGQPLDHVLGSGQAVLVSALLTAFVGVTDGDGQLKIVAPLPASVPLGLDIRVQAVAFAGGKSLSNGLLLHVAGP